ARRPAVLPGRVAAGRVEGVGHRLVRLTAALQDRGGSRMELVWFWRGPRSQWAARQKLERLQEAGEMLVLGTPLQRQGRWQMSQPEILTPAEAASCGLRTGENVIRPVYPTTAGLRESQLALWIRHALVHVAWLFPEFLPESW